MKAIEDNPYRLLGVYANSPTKDRVANHNKLKAFLKVGKPMAFPLDLTQYLSPIDRTADSVAQADASLTLPREQLKHAQFWFINVTPLDRVAFNHLFEGDMDGAVSIWQKKDNASSLQNRAICALMGENYMEAMHCAEQLYSQYAGQFVSAVMGEGSSLIFDGLAHDFLDTLCDEMDTGTLLSAVHDAEWREYIKVKSVKPLLDTLLAAIETAKSTRGKGITARYEAGVKLMNDTKDALRQLRTLLPPGDLQYQMTADKLGLEILQCGIDYFNGSDAADAARKAMRLQSYAMSIVVGKMAKDRCKENCDILQRIIDNLPPAEVYAEDRAIKEELRKFCLLPDKISHAVTLLNNTKPHLQSIKAKLGASNAYYLKTSTQVVGNALHNVIEEVNDAQRDEFVEIGGQKVPISMLLDRDEKLSQIKAALKAAWNAILLMDTFDMEQDFRTDRYNPNRATLKDMCRQMGISTASSSSSTLRPTSNNPRPSQRPNTPRQATTTGTPPPTNTSSNSSSGLNWLWMSFALFLLIILIMFLCSLKI